MNRLTKIGTAYPKRGKDIYEYVEVLLSKPGDNPPVHISSPKGIVETIDDLALVMCNFGNEPKRKAATAKAIRWTMSSLPRPLIVIVDAQEEGGTHDYDSLASDNTVVINKTVPAESKGLFIKEALWNIGAKHVIDNYSGITKLVFLDMDCEFVDQMWASAVSDALNTYDCISPHMASYYAEADDTWPKGLTASVGYNQTLSPPMPGFQGMAFGCTKEFYINRLDSEIKLISTGAGDTYLWYDIIGKGAVNLGPNSFVRRYGPDRDSSGMVPRPKVGHGYQIVAHRDHGSKDDRQYQQRMALIKRCTSRHFEEYEYNDDGIPIWSNSRAGILMSRIMPRMIGSKSTMQEVMNMYEQEAVDIYGAITPTHPLIVTCLLRSGGEFTGRHVRWLRDQFYKHCQASFRFVCQSDIEIEDIETIPLELGIDKAMGSSSQAEHYRNIWPENASVLTCDIDTVISRPFVPHRCPEDRFFMLREYGHWNRAATVWASGMTYFRGDYSFIYDEYLEHINGPYAQRPRYIYRGAQEFLVAVLRKHGIRPDDIEPHFCYRYWEPRDPNYRGDAAFLIFPAWPKPWDVRNCNFIPALNEE